MKIKNQFSLIKQVKKAPVKVLFLKIIIFQFRQFFRYRSSYGIISLFYEFSNPLGWAWAGKPSPPFGLLSDMALETSPKICHFFNHLLIVPLATSNLSAIACKVIPVALNSLACSLLSQLATPFLTHLIDLFWLVSR